MLAAKKRNHHPGLAHPTALANIKVEAGVPALEHLPTGGLRACGIISANAGLTPQEQVVLKLLMLGRDTNGIAQQLFVTIHAVRKHLKGIYAKCGVSCIYELYGLIIRHIS